MHANPYPGVNAHLNSALQQRGGGWRSFHSKHITHIADMIEPLLPDGYFTSEESSLQIGAYDPETDTLIATSTTTVADVGVYREKSVAVSATGTGYAAQPSTLLLPLHETMLAEDVLSGVVIYRLRDDGDAVPVTRIELLSPANKYPGSHAITYLTKRSQALYSGLRLIEIDYLHAQGPLLKRIPDYSAGEQGALPYAVIVSDPRPSIAEAQAAVLRWGIMDAIPAVVVPLDGDDRIKVDLNAIYQHTLSRSRQFSRVKVDYTQLPADFDRYQPDDQQHIRELMRSLS